MNSSVGDGEAITCLLLELTLWVSAQVEAEWCQRFDKARAEHDTALESQRSFTANLAEDVQGLKDKCEALEAQVLSKGTRRCLPRPAQP